MGRRIRTKDANAFKLPLSTVILHGILPTLLPFLVCTVGYFFTQKYIRLYPEAQGCLKVTPIFLLAFHTIYRGKPMSKYKHNVTAGLMVSTVGDYYLVWKDETSFLCGMTAFAVAHILYIRAFGFERRATVALVASTSMGAGVTMLLLPYLDEVLSVGLPIYVALISVTCWRAFARLDPFDWTKCSAAVGALMFGVSDFNLALNAFYLTHPYDRHHYLTMFLYYLGQLGIALSTVDRKEMVETHLMKKYILSQQSITDPFNVNQSSTKKK